MNKWPRELLNLYQEDAPKDARLQHKAAACVSRGSNMKSEGVNDAFTRCCLNMLYSAQSSSMQTCTLILLNRSCRLNLNNRAVIQLLPDM